MAYFSHIFVDIFFCMHNHKKFFFSSCVIVFSIQHSNFFYPLQYSHVIIDEGPREVFIRSEVLRSQHIYDLSRNMRYGNLNSRCMRCIWRSQKSSKFWTYCDICETFGTSNWGFSVIFVRRLGRQNLEIL